MGRNLATPVGFHNYAVERGVFSDYQGGEGFESQTLTGNKTLTRQSPVFQLLNPGGANRNVVLPPAAGSPGRAFRVVNRAGAAENLVVVDSDGVTTIVTINQNEAAWVISDGTSWTHAGVETVALT